MKIIFTFIFLTCSVAAFAEKNYTFRGLLAAVRGDYVNAAELFQQACDSGGANGCFYIGLMYKKGEGVKQDYLKAAELFRKACDNGDMRGCTGSGMSHQWK